MSYNEKFKKDDGSFYPMQTALGGEYKIEHNGKSLEVDGCVQTNSDLFLLEFYGCRTVLLRDQNPFRPEVKIPRFVTRIFTSGRNGFWSLKSTRFRFHSHNCGVHCVNGQTGKRDREKETALRQYGTVLTIYECEWKKQREREIGGTGAWRRGPKSPISKFYYHDDPISENEIFEQVFNDRFEGLLLVDLETPDNLRESFKALNVGTIFSRIIVTEDMLDSKMKEMCEIKGLKSPYNPQLSMVFNAKRYLCTSSMLKMYHSWGMIIKNLEIALEYQKGYPLKSFITTVTNKRIIATERKDATLQNLYKLVANSR